jgi:uncharacterized protein YkwD
VLSKLTEYMGFVISLLAASMVASSAHAAPPTAQQVLTELNKVRANPHGYANVLRAYRDRFEGRVVYPSEEEPGITTAEGIAAVDEAIAFLDSQPPIISLTLAPLLNHSAEDHALDQSRTGRAGHIGSDGSNFGERIHRGALWQGEASEAISYGMDTAAHVVRQLIIDDGVPSRGHRATLFDPLLRNVGVGCEPHPAYSQVCVLDFATAVVDRTSLAYRP